MSLTDAFAKTLNHLGLHPANWQREQMQVAIDANDSDAVVGVLMNAPRGKAIYIPGENGNRTLHMFEYALVCHKFGAAEAMVQLAPEVLTRDYSLGEAFVNRSILMQRAIMGNEKEIEFLLGLKADVNAKDDDGETALHFGAGQGKHETVEMLVNAGADVNAANKAGVTPLMQATKGDSNQMARQMLGHGADIAVCDSKGLNATMHAIHNQNIKAAQFLMENGGKVTDHADPAIERLRRVAENEAEWDFIRLLNSQYDINRNRQDALAKMTIKEICETGTAEDIKVKRIRLKGQTP